MKLNEKGLLLDFTEIRYILKDEKVKTILIDLGWTPPEGSSEINRDIVRNKNPKGYYKNPDNLTKQDWIDFYNTVEPFMED